MTSPQKFLQGRAIGGKRIFPERSRSFFRSSYPEGTHRLEHNLVDHPLLELDALALLGEALPPASLEYDRDDLPAGADGEPERNSLTIGETIRNIETARSWAVLKNIEQIGPFAGLLEELLDELRPIIEARTGEILRPQGYICLSSPGAVMPYRCDPWHNIRLQLRGHKRMTVFPPGDPRFASGQPHETLSPDGGLEHDCDRGLGFDLHPGDAIYLPVMAPHHVRNGDDVSISLSITWHSEWSLAEADARAFNGLLRKIGLHPAPPRRWPATNGGKAAAMRIVRRFRPLA